MTIAEMTSRRIAMGKQSAQGTPANVNDGFYVNFRPDTSGGLTKESFESDSIRRDQQYNNPRHGLRSGEFSLSQELQIGGHKELLAAALRAAWVNGVTTGALTNVGIDATTRTITRAAGSFLTDGFKVGDIVRYDASGGGPAGNEGVNLRLTAVTALTMVYAADPWTTGIVTDAAGDSVTISVPGAKLIVPSSGHTKDYFTVDDFHDDIDQNTLITDAVVGSVEIDIQPGAHAHITFNMLGTNAAAGTAQYFVTPDAEPTGALLAGPEGKLRYDNADSSVLTGIQLTIDSGAEVKAVIGGNTSPDVFREGVKVSGSFSSLHDGGSVYVNFDDEVEAPLIIYLFADSTPGAHFLCIKIPRCKMNSADKGNDGPAVTLSGEWTAGKESTSTTYDLTTIAIIDSSLTA